MNICELIIKEKLLCEFNKCIGKVKYFCGYLRKNSSISGGIFVNKKRLYVIGNGFDCMYGLPTRVLDFERHLSEKQVYNEIDDAKEILDIYGVHWGEFEEGLSHIDTQEIYRSNVQFHELL